MIDMWVVLLLLTKLTVYVGAAALLGGHITLLMASTRTQRKPLNQPWQKTVLVYMLIFASTGLIASILDYFLQVGSLAQNGIAGMIDPIMMEIVFKSAIGDVAINRVVLFASLLLLHAYYYWRVWRLKKSIPSAVLAITSLLITGGIGYTFSLLGHTTQLDSFASGLIAVHVVIALWWMGSLWPLYKACDSLDERNLHDLMDLFGRFATYAVAILILAGAILLWQLMGPWSAFIDSQYGIAFSVKLSLVALIMLLAARHKFKLVPRILSHQAGARTLKVSIAIEMALGASILLVTAVITSILGPTT